jgi:hypothetical protein
MIKEEQPTATELMLEFFKDPLNLKVAFFLNDASPADFPAGELVNIMRNKDNCNISKDHRRNCLRTLQKFDVIRTTRKIHGTRVYAFNSESELSQKLFELCKTFDNIYSIVMNLPPKPVFVDRRFYEDKQWAKEGHW